jgi:hypothetical protein
MSPRIEIIILNSIDKLIFFLIIINIKEQKLNFGYVLVLIFEHQPHSISYFQKTVI